MCFGTTYNTLQNKDKSFYEAWEILNEVGFYRSLFKIPYWHYIHFQKDRDYEKAKQLLHGSIQKMVDKYKKEGIPEDADNFLAYMMRSTQQEENPKVKRSFDC